MTNDCVNKCSEMFTVPPEVKRGLVEGQGRPSRLSPRSRPMPLPSPIRTLRRVSADASVDPNDPDDLWPRPGSRNTISSPLDYLKPNPIKSFNLNPKTLFDGSRRFDCPSAAFGFSFKVSSCFSLSLSLQIAEFADFAPIALIAQIA